MKNEKKKAPAKKSQPKNTDSKPLKLKKKRKNQIIIFLIILLVWWFNNYTLKTERVKLESAKIHSDIKFAVISDMHADCGGISKETIAQRVISNKPDAVFIIGDMFTSDADDEEKHIPVELTEMLIENGLSVYFVTGDHDNMDSRYLADMQNLGAHLMNYESEYIDIGGDLIRIIGIDNAYYSDTFDLRNAFTLDSGIYTVLLAHIPKYDSFAQFGADLTICGDTHGGMVQIPFGFGPVYDSETNAKLPKIRFPEMKIYDKGMFEYSGGGMFISSGTGLYPAPVRFNNRPEIDIIEVKAIG